MNTNRLLPSRLWLAFFSIFFGCTLVVAGLSAARSARAALELSPASRYLAPAGADSGDCTDPAAPCQTLQYAIAHAAPGDSLLLAAGTYASVQTLAGHTQIALITKTLTLLGGYNPTFTGRTPAATPTLLNANGQGRVIFATGSLTLTLDGLHLLAGSTQGDPGGLNPGGGIYAKGVNLYLLDSRIEACHTRLGDGNGLYIESGVLKMDRSVIQANTPLGSEEWNESEGGGLYATLSQVEITDSHILSNTAGLTREQHSLYQAHGGGAYLDRSTSLLRRVTFQGNLAATQTYGQGGGLYANQGSLQLLDSTFVRNRAANTGYGSGGALELNTPAALVSGNSFLSNTASAWAGYGGAIHVGAVAGVAIQNNRFESNLSANDGGGGAIAADPSYPVTIAANEILNNSAGSKGRGGGLYLSGKAVSTRLAVVRDNLLQANWAGANGGAIYLAGTIDLLNNRLIANSTAGSGGAIYQTEYSEKDAGLAVYDGNLLQGNTAALDGGGLYIKTTFSQNLVTHYRNMAFIDNTSGGRGGGIYVYRYTYAPTGFSHLTLSGNTAADGSTFFADGGKILITNTLITRAAIGLFVDTYVSANHVFFGAVLTPTASIWAVITPCITLQGNAGLAEDSYHLTPASQAIDAGLPTALTADIDKQPRPMGAAPDIGADESPYSAAGATVQAGLIAAQPEWKLSYAGINVPLDTVLEQTYLIPFANYHPSLSVTHYTIEDHFPANLDLAEVTNQPALDYTAAGSLLTWASRTPLQPGDWGWIGLTGRSSSAVPGDQLVSTGKMAYTLSDGANGTIDLSAAITVPDRPVFTPLMVTPNNGEMCLDEQGRLSARGLSSPGSQVKIYENDQFRTAVTAGPDGVFDAAWVSVLTHTLPVDVYALACEAGEVCSPPTPTVHLAYPEGNWCPQRSYWEGDVAGAHFEFHFRNSQGNFATNDFLIPGVGGFINTRLHLYSCCQGELNPFRILADGKTYTAPSGHSGHWWTFDIQGAHSVSIFSDCQGGSGSSGETTSSGTILIDPDGFVFDSAHGGSYDPATGMFAPLQPLAGITVTAYVSATQWGQWIPWPAHLYDNQINPQVTGSSGYFAFFTPPGLYYLEVTAAGGYQSWRSPEIEVIAEIVHMNAPLTRWSAAAPLTALALTPSGPSQSTVYVPVGATVEWRASLPGISFPASSAAQFAWLAAHPRQRLLSALDPLTSLLGWDSGMLPPGAVYRRQFTHPGVYTYTDGYGHPAQIIVTSPIYLPIILRHH